MKQQWYIFLDINDRKKIALPNYNYKIGEMDGRDMRSIFERWKDKRSQEERMEEIKWKVF